MKIINLKFGDILFKTFFTSYSLIDIKIILSLLRSDVTKSADLIFLEIGTKKTGDNTFRPNIPRIEFCWSFPAISRSAGVMMSPEGARVAEELTRKPAFYRTETAGWSPYIISICRSPIPGPVGQRVNMIYSKVLE